MRIICRDANLDAIGRTEALAGEAFTGEAGGHKFVITAKRGGQAVALDGNVYGVFIAPNGDGIALTNTNAGIDEDGRAWVTLDPACYQQRGCFGIRIFNAGTNETVTVIWSGAGYMSVGEPETIYDPGDVINLAAIEAKIAEMDAASEACEEATASAQQAASFVNSIIAPTHSPGVTYVIGNYCTYEGSMYRCKNPTSGDFDPNDWDQVLVGGEFSRLNGEVGNVKSAVEEISTQKLTKISDEIITGKYIDNYGAVVNASSGASQWEVTDYVDVSGLDKVAITAGSYSNRMYYAFYNDNKVYIANSGKAYVADTVLRDYIVDVPSGAKYCVAMWYYSVSANDPVIKRVDLIPDPTGLVEYGSVQSLTTEQKAQARSNISAMASDAIGGGTVQFVPGVDDVISDKAYDVSYSKLWLNPDSTGWKTMKPIDIGDIKVGSDIKVKASLANSHGVIITDANLNVLDYVTSDNAVSRGYTVTTVYQLITMTVPANAKYITTSLRDLYYTGVSDFTVTAVEMTDVEKNTRDIEALEATKTSILHGKKWCPCGDSFTEYTNAQFADGLFIGYDKTYPRLIALRNEMTLYTAFMAKGKTMAYPTDGTVTNSLTCPTSPGYYQNIPADADYITIMLGINDYGHGSAQTGNIQLGTIDDSGTATYCGAYNAVLGWLRENRPFAHVGIIVTNGTANQAYTEAQIALARKWGYPFLNLNGDDRTPAMLSCYNTSMSASLKTMIGQIQAIDFDGTQTGSVDKHPNWKAQEYESAFIEDWLRTI